MIPTCRTRWLWRGGALLLALICWFAPEAPAAEEGAAFQVVRPDDEAHSLLPKTCRVCHKEGELRFFIVAAPDAKGLDAAANLLLGGPAAGGAVRRVNPHARTLCLFCHLSEPEPGAPADGMEFRTLDGKPAHHDDVERLCRMCHPAEGWRHRQVNDDEPEGDLAVAKLMKEGDDPVCSTCHDMHAEETGPASLKKSYLDFAENSIHSFPHGNRAGCAACHPRDFAPDAKTPVFREADGIRRCARCHPKSHDKIHPVSVKPTEKTYPMDFLDYPLAADRTMTCSTCHDEPCASGPATGNRDYLRGGPYRTPTDFCYTCHPRSGDGSLSPHKQVDEKGNVLQTSCVFCHVRGGGMAYLYSPSELCLRCHDIPNHPDVNHLVEMDEKRVEKLHAYEKRHNVKLPLDAENRVTCTTCHNPHAKGVVAGEAALGAEEEKRWRVPSFAELCTPCHQRFD